MTCVTCVTCDVCDVCLSGLSKLMCDVCDVCLSGPQGLCVTCVTYIDGMFAIFFRADFDIKLRVEMRVV